MNQSHPQHYDPTLTDKEHLSASLREVVAFLVQKKLLSKSSQMLIHLEKTINKKEGIMKAKVLSAHPLSAEAKRNLIQNLLKHYSAKEIVLEEAIDPKLIGGVRVEIGDEIIDLTLRNRINQLKNHLTKHDHE